MDTMPSSEFRRRYATLTEHTEVTVNGHVIGRWLPVDAPIWASVNVNVHAKPVDPAEPVERYNSRPFTPVPKK